MNIGIFLLISLRNFRSRVAVRTCKAQLLLVLLDIMKMKRVHKITRIKNYTAYLLSLVFGIVARYWNEDWVGGVEIGPYVTCHPERLVCS